MHRLAAAVDGGDGDGGRPRVREARVDRRIDHERDALHERAGGGVRQPVRLERRQADAAVSERRGYDERQAEARLRGRHGGRVACHAEGLAIARHVDGGNGLGRH